MDTLDCEKTFTGIDYLDCKIFNYLEDKDLVSIFRTNKYCNNICNSKYSDIKLWMNRVLFRFPLMEMIKTSEETETGKCKIHKNQKGNRTWKQYYIEDLSVLNKDKVDLYHVLLEASWDGKLATVIEIIDIVKNAPGIYEDEVINYKNTALRNASGYGRLNVVKYLIEKGADIHYMNDTAIRVAGLNQHWNIVKYLIGKGANVRANESEVLIWASSYGCLYMVKHLVELGADVQSDQNYALREASSNGHLNVVEYLVYNGADINDYDNAPLKKACVYGHFDVVKYLVENGANIHADNDYALRWASQRGYFYIVKYLVENGANIAANDCEAFNWATQSKNFGVSSYLANMAYQQGLL